MGIVEKIIVWGLVAGLIHFVAVGALYMNPIVAGLYKGFADHPGMRRWESQPKYVASMFVGTLIEVWILAGAFFYFVPLFNLDRSIAALVTGFLFAGIRVYPRFFNMWIQSSYPRRLLAVEFVNGTIGTFVVTGTLAYLGM